MCGSILGYTVKSGNMFHSNLHCIMCTSHPSTPSLPTPTLPTHNLPIPPHFVNKTSLIGTNLSTVMLPPLPHPTYRHFLPASSETFPVRRRTLCNISLPGSSAIFVLCSVSLQPRHCSLIRHSESEQHFTAKPTVSHLPLSKQTNRQKCWSEGLF